MISVKDLDFDYPDKRALIDVCFFIEKGTITALVGPNGSGKTTLLRSLAALASPIRGEILINGFDTASQPQEVHSQVGFLQDLFGLYDALTVQQCLQFMAYSRIHGNHDPGPALEKAIGSTGVSSFLDKPIGTLSRGMRQRVGIAAAIIHNPAVLLLDEPASGLDPEARYELSRLMVQLGGEGMTIIVSSHILAELADYSSHMLVLQDGHVVEHRKIAGTSSFRPEVWMDMVVAESPGPDFPSRLRAIPGILELEEKEGRFQVKLDLNTTSKATFLRESVLAGIAVAEFAEVRTNLQDEYIKSVARFKQTRTP